MSMEFIVDNTSVCGNCFYKYNPPKFEVVIERIDDEDRISNLPDDVIGNVLSRIPTRHAVQTSVLSRNWKYKWTSIHNICIDGPCGSFVAESLSPSFINGVNMILGLTHEKIRNFHLFCVNKYDTRQLTTWISAVLRRGVQNVVVGGNINGFVVTLADYSALVELKLSFQMCIVRVSVNECFPNLRKLCLDGIFKGFQIVNRQPGGNTGQLLLNFPVLQYLELNYCKFFKVNYVEIRAPELVTFKANHSYGLALNDCVIKIYGPKLLKFYSSGGYVNFFDLYAPLVQYVDLRHQDARSDFVADQARAILKEVPGLTWLLLYHADVQALVERKQDVPNFDRLVRLEVNSSSAEPLLELLHTMPNLEYLNISFWADFVNRQNGALPLCIVFNLKEVKFMDFYGGSNQIDLIKLFLKNAKKLERVIVYPVKPGMTESEIDFHLSTLASTSSARIIISEKQRLTSFEQEFLEAEKGCKVHKAE